MAPTKIPDELHPMTVLRHAEGMILHSRAPPNIAQYEHLHRDILDCRLPRREEPSGDPAIHRRGRYQRCQVKAAKLTTKYIADEEQYGQHNGNLLCSDRFSHCVGFGMWLQGLQPTSLC